MKDKMINTRADLDGVLAQVTFAPSCVNLDWKWDVKEIWERGPYDPDSDHLFGWLVRVSFLRPDTDTGEVTRGFGRWEVVEQGASESGVVKTCWVLLNMNTYHELMEMFLYKGAKIFNPHHSVNALAHMAAVHGDWMDE